MLEIPDHSYLDRYLRIKEFYINLFLRDKLKNLIIGNIFLLFPEEMNLGLYVKPSCHAFGGVTPRGMKIDRGQREASNSIFVLNRNSG
jgi:hypothetical protein